MRASRLGRSRLARWEALVRAQETALARSLGEDRVDALLQALVELVDDGPEPFISPSPDD